MERVKLRIRIPEIYSCITEDCTELTRTYMCKSCHEDMLKSYRGRREHNSLGLRVESTSREGFVSIERRCSTYYLSG